MRLTDIASETKLNKLTFLTSSSLTLERDRLRQQSRTKQFHTTIYLIPTLLAGPTYINPNTHNHGNIHRMA